MHPYNGQLNPNEILGAFFNMIISQQVATDNIDGLDSSLVNEARVDGGLYGDTKLYYATDALHSTEWTGDDEALNLLQLHRPTKMECQSITLDKFRQIPLTIDNYLSKKAWGNEGVFATFNGSLLAWLTGTKAIYDTLTYNTFVGTNVSKTATQNIEIQLPKNDTEEHRRLRAQTVAQEITNLAIHMKDVCRDFNDYNFMRSYKKSMIKVIWNAEFVTELTKLDIPTIFNDDTLFGSGAFERTLPARFFGTVNASGSTTPSDNKRVRSLVEKQFGSKFCYPGDLLPNSQAYGDNETYTEDPNVICKVVVKLPPYMSAFEVGTSFFNPRSLTENHYLTWGHNTLEHLKNYPYITIKGKTLA